MSPTFVHLRIHTEFSLIDGVVRIKPLVRTLESLGMPAAAVTEQGNLFSLVKFYRAAQAAGVKPIVGADVWVVNPEDVNAPHRLTLLARNRQGYVTLTELISRAYQEGQYLGTPMLRKAWIAENAQGLIALSGAMDGDIGQALLADNPAQARACAEFWREVFPDCFYLEVQRVGKAEEERYLLLAAELGADLDLPLVATNDVRFLRPEDFEAHEVRVCINQGRVLDDSRRPRNYTDRQYLRSAEEMAELFADIPAALVNSVAIAMRCNVALSLGENYLPDFPVPEGLSVADYFRQTSRQGLEERLAAWPPAGDGDIAVTRRIYDQRLETELDVIIQMGFPGYFLIVADFIQWAKQHGIPVGPGRGSGAGSLVAYALNITDLDPIEFDLLFERFLNPERVSMPDFDIDFCMERRDEVIDYVARRYGRERVSQIITYGSMAAKAVIRDVGRVMSLSYGFVDRLAKLIPFEIGMTLDKALRDSPELKQLYDGEEEVKGLIDMAQALEGMARNAGKHAGGVVIAPSKLTDFTPLYCEEGGGNLVTQFDKDDVEAVGLVKFDFLGLRTLTIIDWALQTINARRAARGEEPIDIARIPRDDAPTYDWLKQARTTAVFQLESRGMKELIKKLKPDCFDDIIALVALFRPGPLESGMVDDYINVKHGAKAEYAHPILEPILNPTNGVILYQEQVMQIAREMAGYTLGGADMLRRAMGKKKPEEMAKQRESFTAGALQNGIDVSVASHIFDLMEKFAGYGFNKSHSAAYALVAYQTAWLKRHHSAAFMAAVMSSDMDNTDKVVVLIEECRALKLSIRPPDVNYSAYRFTVDAEDNIVYGLGAIKGVGENAIQDLVAARNQEGLYQNLYDFCRRVDLRKVNRRVLEALIKSGAMDSLHANRAALLAELDTALKTAEQRGKMLEAGQHDLFGLDGLQETAAASGQSAPAPEWPEREKLEAEKQTLGFFLSGHPISEYLPELRQFTHAALGDLETGGERGRGKLEGRFAGMIVDLRLRQSKTGKTMAFATIDDRSGKLEVAVYNEAYQKYRELLVKDAILVAEGGLGVDEFTNSWRLAADKLYGIEQAREMFARGLHLVWRRGEWTAQRDFCAELAAALSPYAGGRCPVFLEFLGGEAKAALQLGDAWRVRPADELFIALRRLLGRDGVQLRYK